MFTHYHAQSTVLDMEIRSEVKRPQGAGHAAFCTHTINSVLYALTTPALVIRPDFHVHDRMKGLQYGHTNQQLLLTVLHDCCDSPSRLKYWYGGVRFTNHTWASMTRISSKGCFWLHRTEYTLNCRFLNRQSCWPRISLAPCHCLMVPLIHDQEQGRIES